MASHRPPGRSGLGVAVGHHRERAVIVDEGRTLRFITMIPVGRFVTSLQQRI